MERTINDLLSRLREFAPVKDEALTVSRLYDILDGLDDMPARETALPVLLSVIERFVTADLGSPGPLVHAIEGIPGYEIALRESLRRQPAPLSVWMANRILNRPATAAVRDEWLAELHAARDHPLTTEAIRTEVDFFLDHQSRNASTA